MGARQRVRKWGAAAWAVVSGQCSGRLRRLGAERTDSLSGSAPDAEARPLHPLNLLGLRPERLGSGPPVVRWRFPSRKVGISRCSLKRVIRNRCSSGLRGRRYGELTSFFSMCAPAGVGRSTGLPRQRRGPSIIGALTACRLWATGNPFGACPSSSFARCAPDDFATVFEHRTPNAEHSAPDTRHPKPS